jgi:hypothetical protein
MATQPVRRSWMGRVIAWLGLGFVLLVWSGGCFSAGLILGLLRGEGGAYHRQYLEERNAIAPILMNDPAFAGVEIHEASDGGVWVGGKVPTQADKNRLREALIRAIGEGRAQQRAATGVTVAEQPGR